MMLAMELIWSMEGALLGWGTDMEGLPPFQFLPKSDAWASSGAVRGGLLEVFLGQERSFGGLFVNLT
jgi:hypothetical protein